MILLYDGSFEGFLSLVYEVYYQKLEPKVIYKKIPSKLCFEEIYTIETDINKAKKVFTSLQKTFSKSHLNTIYHVFLCDSQNFEYDLLSFIQLGFKKQNNLSNITHPSIFRTHALEKEYLRLAHKMYGFVRFEELDDKIFYAKVETKFNILILLGNHFNKRLGNHPFIIHDIHRSLAYIKDNNFRGIKEVAKFETPLHSDDEKYFKTLWKTFFHSVAIENRKNHKLQKQLVPLIYRTHMCEFQDD